MVSKENSLWYTEGSTGLPRLLYIYIHTYLDPISRSPVSLSLSLTISDTNSDDTTLLAQNRVSYEMAKLITSRLRKWMSRDKTPPRGRHDRSWANSRRSFFAYTSLLPRSFRSHRSLPSFSYLAVPLGYFTNLVHSSRIKWNRPEGRTPVRPSSLSRGEEPGEKKKREKTRREAERMRKVIFRPRRFQSTSFSSTRRFAAPSALLCGPEHFLTRKHFYRRISRKGSV